MTAATAEYRRVIDDVKGLVPALTRVVNTWFESDRQTVPPAQHLRPGASYSLQVNVGLPTRQSIVVSPVSLDHYLQARYSGGGARLRVILSGSDFAVDEPEQLLIVPEPPGASETISFTVRAPKEAGSARLRVGLYDRNNLVQSLLITASIDAAPSSDRDTGGCRAEVEWVLSGTIGNLDRIRASDTQPANQRVHHWRARLPGGW